MDCVKMRIFLGLLEVCNITNTYAKGLKYLGYQTLTGTVKKDPYFPDSDYDMVICPNRRIEIQSYFRMLYLFARALLSCDIFFFTYYSFLPHFWDLPFLKILGKRIVFIFWGSEVRSIDAFEKHILALGLEKEFKPFIDSVRNAGEEPLINKLRLIRAAEKYSDLILSQPGYAQLQNSPYKRANIPLDLSLFHFKVPGRKNPLILHAPSNKLTKGTEDILRVVRKLKEEGVQFTFKLIENMSNRELRQLLSEADIVVDELYADTLGVLSTEGMATGNAVLVHYPEFAQVPQPCPAININRVNLIDNLRKVILDLPWRIQLANEGRIYVEMHNDHIKIVSQILEWLNEKCNAPLKLDTGDN